MWVIAIIEIPDVIKKNSQAPGLVGYEPKAVAMANGPPIDVFPAYDDQQVLSTDGYVRDPECPAKAYF
jgi:hypothetical protein